MSNALLSLTDRGLYCAPGDFYIDPWPGPDDHVRRAVVTHGHADHARPGAERYFATRETVAIMQTRLGSQIAATALRCGEPRDFGPVRVSLHPAGHVLGSAQVRVEHEGEVWVVTGDFKRDPDPTCKPFEVVRCDTLITEATFALPIYRWQSGARVAADIAHWIERNRSAGRTSVLFCYALGKAQRVLAELAPHLEGPVYLHGAMRRLVDLYRELGVALPHTVPVSEADPVELPGALVLAPPSAAGSPWMRRFKKHSTGFVSGWMRVRGNRRRRGYDRGFVLSDHADWPSLIQTVRDSGAHRILATHGKSDVLVRYLQEQGLAAQALQTRFGESEDET